MSFSRIVKQNARRAKREAQKAHMARDPLWLTLSKMPTRPNDLMEAACLSLVATIDSRTKEVLMISPRATMPDHANQ